MFPSDLANGNKILNANVRCLYHKTTQAAHHFLRTVCICYNPLARPLFSALVAARMHHHRG